MFVFCKPGDVCGGNVSKDWAGALTISPFLNHIGPHSPAVLEKKCLQILKCMLYACTASEPPAY